MGCDWFTFKEYSFGGSDPYKANDWAENPKDRKGQIADYMTAALREGAEKERKEGEQEYNAAHMWTPESAGLIPGMSGYKWQAIPIGDGQGTIMRSERRDPETGKMREVWLTSDGNTFGTKTEAMSWQKQTNDYNAAVASAQSAGAAPSSGDTDKFGNVTLKGREHMEETAVRSLENQRAAYVESRYGKDGYQYDAQAGSMPGSAVAMRSAPADNTAAMYDEAIRVRKENVARLARQREGKADSFFQGVADAVSDPNTWFFDLPGLSQTMKVWDAYKVYKSGRGGSEGHAARALLSAVTDSQDLAGAYKDGDVYSFGINAVKSVQLYANMGLTSGITSGLRSTSKALGRLAAMQVRNAAGKFFLRSLGTLSGDALSGLVVTNTAGLGSTMNDAMQRYHGTLVRNDDGSYGFATFDRDGNRLHDGGESLLSSFLHAESTGLFNNMSEYGGDSFIDPALKKLTGKMNLGALTQAVSRLDNNAVWQASKRLARKANIQSLPGEALEEYYNNVLGLLNGDTKPEDFLSSDMHKQNILGTAATMAFMGALPFAGAVTVEAGSKLKRMAMPYRYRHLVRRASDRGSSVFGDDWEGVRDALDGTPSEDMESKVRELLGGLGEAQQKVVLDYATALTALRAHNVGRSVRDKALAGKGSAGETDRQDLSDAHHEAAYAQGRNMPGDKLGSVKPDYEAKRKALSAKLGVSEDELENMDDDALEGMMGRDDDLDLSIMNYQDAKYRMHGVIDQARDDMDAEAGVVGDMMDHAVNPQDGMLHPAELDDGRKVYIINGTVSMTADGTMVDKEASDESVVVYDSVSGKTEMTAPEHIKSIDAPVDGLSARAHAVDAARQKFAAERADQIDGLTPKPNAQLNDDVWVKDEQGDAVHGVVTQVDPLTGQYMVQTDSPVNGKKVQPFVAGELYEKAGEDGDSSGEDAVRDGETGARPAQGAATTPDAGSARTATGTKYAVNQENLDKEDPDEKNYFQTKAQIVVDYLNGDIDVKEFLTELGYLMPNVLPEEYEEYANQEVGKMLDRGLISKNTQPVEQQTGRATDRNSSEEDGNPDNGVPDWYANLHLSGKTDQNGNPFVLSPEGKIDFANFDGNGKLPSAPIRLSLGDAENGYIHINRRHGKQIMRAGFRSIGDFVTYVANNFTRIKEGEAYDNESGGKNQTYLLQLQDGHNNTLFVQLSRDGSYWNVNSAGVFGKKYGDKKKDVWSASEVQNGEPASASGGLQSEPLTGNGSSSNGTPPNSSAAKLGNSSESADKKSEKISAIDRIPHEQVDDGKGNVRTVHNWEEASPGDTYDALTEIYHDNADRVKKGIDNRIVKIDKAIKGVQKKMDAIDNSDDFDEVAAQSEQYDQLQQQKDALEKQKKYWQGVQAVPQQRRQAEDRRTAEEKAAAKAAQEKAEAEALERARQEREKVNGVPDVVNDVPSDARKRGFRNVNGTVVERQGATEGVTGRESSVKFSSKDTVKGHLKVIEADDLQPSHVRGQRNPQFFIDEAQPKDRTDAASSMAAAKIAANMNPEEITGDGSAYQFSAPTVNSRGEVIQGNNRSDALKLMWSGTSLTPVQAAYKEYLISHADEFGFTPEDVERIRQMKHPVMVNEVDVTDDDAIRLGQMKAGDNESGGLERIDPVTTSQKLGHKVGSFANVLLSSGDEDASLSDVLSENGGKAVHWLRTQGVISDTAEQSAFDKKGNLTPEAKQDLQNILKQSLFQGGVSDLPTMFEKMPAKAQKAVLSTFMRDFDSAESERILPEIQKAIEAWYGCAMSNDAFAKAGNYKSAKTAMRDWTLQTNMLDDSMPSDKFSNFAMELACRLQGCSMRETQQNLNDFFDLVQGKSQGDLFGGTTMGEQADRQEAIRRVFDIDYKPINNKENGKTGSDAVADNGSQGGEGRQGSPADVKGRERAESGGGSADGGGRDKEHPQGRGEDGGTSADERGRQGDTSNPERRQHETKEVDENGLPFVLAPDGSTIYGEVRENSGLPEAPIKLSVGFQDENGKGYGLRHIEANHGAQIRKEGFANVQDFVSFVAKNYDEDNIRVGKRRENGSITYLLQVSDAHDNTLFVELSRDGSYWNVNSAGVFRKGYSNKKETVAKTEPQQPNNAISTGSSLSADKDGGIMSAKPNGKPTVSAAKLGNSSESGDKKSENVAEGGENSGDRIDEGVVKNVVAEFKRKIDRGNELSEKEHLTDAEKKEFAEIEEMSKQVTEVGKDNTPTEQAAALEILIRYSSLSDEQKEEAKKLLAELRKKYGHSSDEAGADSLRTATKGRALQGVKAGARPAQGTATTPGEDSLRTGAEAGEARHDGQSGREHRVEGSGGVVSAEEAALRDGLSDLMRETGIEVIDDVAEGQRVLDMANDARLMSFGEPYDYEKYPLGRVEPGISNKEVGVVAASSNHGFANYKEAKAWAKENVAKTYNAEETGGKGEVRISNGAVDKFLSQSAVDKSDSKDVHLAVLKVLPDVLKESIDVETHPDFLKGKDGKRSADNGTNRDVLVHRCYGAVSIDGKLYRVKITLKEDVRNKSLPSNTHSYEATKIELLAGTLAKPEGDNPNTNNSIPAANLLKNVGLSYNPSEKVLAASEKRTKSIREQRVYHGSGADFDHFDHSHMGEGEGAQAHGWGTYVTKNEGVGMTYAAKSNKVTGLRRSELESNIRRAEEQLPYLKGEVKAAKEKELQDWRAELNNLNGSKFVYTVDIPDNTGDNYLEENGPLSAEQQKKIAEEAEIEGYGDYTLSYRDENGDLILNTDASNGRWVYKELIGVLGSPQGASEFLSRAGFTGIHYDGRKDGDCYVIFNDKDLKITDKVRFFRTANGDAYGYTVGGKIYIDPRIATSETPIHEYAHLWAEALRKVNPKEWANVVKLMKECKAVWEQVKKEYPELTTDDEIADEVLAHYSGRRGAERLRAEAAKAAEAAKGVLDKASVVNGFIRLKEAIKSAWKHIAEDLLHIHFTNADEVADKMMYDLLNRVKLWKAGDDSLRTGARPAQGTATTPDAGSVRTATKGRALQGVSAAEKAGAQTHEGTSVQSSARTDAGSVRTATKGRALQGVSAAEKAGADSLRTLHGASLLCCNPNFCRLFIFP